MLKLPDPFEMYRGRILKVPREAINLIQEEHAKRMRGEGHALDGHALFCREKFAYALALLDGHLDMTLEDWQLSGIAADVSAYTRDWVTGMVAGAERDAAVQKGQLLGVVNAAAAVEKAHEVNRRVMRVLMNVGEKLRAAGKSGMTQREVAHVVASRDRDALETALNEMVRQRWIFFDAAQGRWFVA